MAHVDISSTILSKLNYFSKLRYFEELSATSKIIANVLADKDLRWQEYRQWRQNQALLVR